MAAQQPEQVNGNERSFSLPSQHQYHVSLSDQAVNNTDFNDDQLRLFAALGIAVNKQFGLIVCLDCQSGVPFEKLRRHLRDCKKIKGVPKESFQTVRDSLSEEINFETPILSSSRQDGHDDASTTVYPENIKELPEEGAKE